MDLAYMKDWIVMLVMVALIGATTAIVLDSFQGDMEVDKITNIVNESVTTSGTFLAQSGLFRAATACLNNSDTPTTGAVKLAGSSCNISSTGLVTFSTVNYSVGGGGAKVDYSHYTPTHQRNMTVNALEGELNATSYFGTMGTIIGVAILITIVLGAFYFMRR